MEAQSDPHDASGTAPRTATCRKTSSGSPPWNLTTENRAEGAFSETSVSINNTS